MKGKYPNNFLAVCSIQSIAAAVTSKGDCTADMVPGITVEPYTTEWVTTAWDNLQAYLQARAVAYRQGAATTTTTTTGDTRV